MAPPIILMGGPAPPTIFLHAYTILDNVVQTLCDVFN